MRCGWSGRRKDVPRDVPIDYEMSGLVSFYLRSVFDDFDRRD
jgi:hypothetical protein